MKEPWNGDISLLNENHVTAMIIDFKKQTVELYVDNEFYGRTGGEYDPVTEARPFTNASSFGQIARGLRRMMTDAVSGMRDAQ